MYRDPRDLCILILYPATLLNSLINSSNFLVASLGISMHNVMSYAESEIFTSYLPIWIPFISFSSLIDMARTSKTTLNNSGQSGHPRLIPNLRGNPLRFSPLIIFAVRLLYHIYYVEIDSFYAPFSGVLFIVNGAEFCQKFFCIY